MQASHNNARTVHILTIQSGDDHQQIGQMNRADSAYIRQSRAGIHQHIVGLELLLDLDLEGIDHQRPRPRFVQFFQVQVRQVVLPIFAPVRTGGQQMNCASTLLLLAHVFGEFRLETQRLDRRQLAVLQSGAQVTDQAFAGCFRVGILELGHQ